MVTIVAAARGRLSGMLPMRLLDTTARYYYTLRHLRPVQFYGRAWFRLYRPTPDTSPAPPVRPCLGRWRPAVPRPPSLHGPCHFQFLNEAHEIQGPGDWNNSGWEKLWLYNLHYFDDLNAGDSDRRSHWHRDLIQRWVDENPPGAGNGWEPYPLSLRIVNWIKWAKRGHALSPQWLHSLAVQVRYLSRRLEWHLLGNHLFANAKALVYAGLFYAGPEADAWLRKGLDILVRELPEQILPDGGHFERSPMYHAIILEDLLDLIHLARDYGPDGIDRAIGDAWEDAVQRMRFWLRAMSHPDGEIAFFNDAALGIAPSPAELEGYAGRLDLPSVNTPGEGMTHLSDSGYIRVQQDSLVLLMDVGQVGPDYLVGHAHADTLSFELSLYGRRVLVNSGTSCYGSSPERLRQRGTAAHNTVSVNGLNSSEVWGGFRVARRAYPRGLKIDDDGDAWRIQCAHDGYRHLSGRPMHRRTWELRKNRLRISDRIHGRRQPAVAHFHFHPEQPPQTNDASRGSIAIEGHQVMWVMHNGQASVKPATYHPGFGESRANQCLEVRFRDAELTTDFSWT